MKMRETIKVISLNLKPKNNYPQLSKTISLIKKQKIRRKIMMLYLSSLKIPTLRTSRNNWENHNKVKLKNLKSS